MVVIQQGPGAAVVGGVAYGGSRDVIAILLQGRKIIQRIIKQLIYSI